MFDLQVSPWELLARAALIYLALLVMVRVSGKRTVGQFTPFDLLVVMLLSEAVSNGLSGGEDSILGAWILAATLIGLNAGIAFLGSRNRRLERLLEGAPVLIGRDGKWFEAVLRRHRLSDLDVEKALRESDCKLSELKIAVLESDGTISVVKRD
ncbi:DUF421 domain-containing protein [Roseateles noduli]|uniref:DUF421 domain-containing protein n=1 Tax=Roseateles noduli TaxID=2052484 RepID=UPI003D64835C